MIQVRNSHPVGYSTSQQEIRYNNTQLIFNLIRDHMPVSRIELARICPLAASTVSNLVDDLLQRNWIIEKETVQSSARGRRAILLSVNEQRGYVATVELLGRGYICTIYSICLKKICGVRIRDTIYDAFTVAATINSLLRSARIAPEMLIGISMIFPGTVDPVSGFLISSPVFPDGELPDRYLSLQLRKQFPDAEVMIVTNGAVIAFEKFAACSEYNVLPLLALNIDEAIFGGVVLSSSDNDMNFCIPVDIGHFIVDYNGALCRCGNRGCMETLCRTPVLFRKLNEKAGLGLEYSEQFGTECNVVSMQRVAKELEKGNAMVEETLREYARAVCAAIVGAVNGFGIRSVHIGGDISLLGEKFLTIVREVFAREFHVLNNTCPLRIELFTSDYEQARLAAAIMCLDKIFRQK